MLSCLSTNAEKYGRASGTRESPHDYMYKHCVLFENSASTLWIYMKVKNAASIHLSVSSGISGCLVLDPLTP